MKTFAAKSRAKSWTAYPRAARLRSIGREPAQYPQRCAVRQILHGPRLQYDEQGRLARRLRYFPTGEIRSVTTLRYEEAPRPGP